MNRMMRLAIVAGAALAVVIGAKALSPEGFSLEVLVDGVPRPEYAGRGAVYVEALKGHSYSLRITNPLSCRVAVALAVDGLNTIDAKHASAWEASKWVLDPHESIVIPGWQVSGSKARKFTFTGERSSYGAALGQTDNLGVIEAVFFREKLPPPPPPVVYEERESGGVEGGIEGGVLGGVLSSPAEARAKGAAAGKPMPAAPQKSEAPKQSSALSDEYAATGMGRATGHEVVHVEIELERVPSAVARIRYEFRPQLVKLGILPSLDPLQRREGARGFEFGYCPQP